jgi:SAM-dependent methyltransferase
MHNGLARLIQRPLYGQAATAYDGLLPRFDPWVVDCLLAACERHLGHAPARTLDLGCGTGRYAVAMAQAGLSVVGLDGARPMLELAAANARQARVPVACVLADLVAPPFEPAFDACLCRGVLNDLVGPGEVQAALCGCARLLRGGGLFLADVRERDAHARRYARQPRGRLASPDGATLEYEARFDAETGHIVVEETLGLPPLPHSLESTLRHTWYMRTFRLLELVALLENAGLGVLDLWGWYDRRAVGEGDRLAVVAQKPPKARGAGYPAPLAPIAPQVSSDMFPQT